MQAVHFNCNGLSRLGDARYQRLVETFGVRHLRRVTELGKLDELESEIAKELGAAKQKD